MLFDAKIFYPFYNDIKNSSDNKTSLKSSSGSSEGKKTGNKGKEKIWSLREISKTNSSNLNKMVFTFNKQLRDGSNLKNDKTQDSQTAKIDLEQLTAVSNVKCMREIDPEFLPSFKFF